MAATLRDAANALLNHALTLPEEDESAEMLKSMGLDAPTGADALLLGQYLKALKGDTAAAKYVRDAALEPEQREDGAAEDLSDLSDAELAALAREPEP